LNAFPLSKVGSIPVLKSARYEKFAQALAKGKTADDAYAARSEGHSLDLGEDFTASRLRLSLLIFQKSGRRW